MRKSWTLEDPEMHQVLERMAGKLCPAWFGPDLRQEVTQEALFRMTELGDREDGEPRTFGSSFLWQMVSNVRNEVARREGRRRQQVAAVEEAGSSSFEPEAETPDPEHVLRSHEIGKAIRHCLKHLKLGHRRAVTMRLLGFTIREIAHHMHCKRKDAENRVYRGLEKLKKCLVSQGATP